MGVVPRGVTMTEPGRELRADKLALALQPIGDFDQIVAFGRSVGEQGQDRAQRLVEQMREV
jgi:hypothetical protein